MSGSGPIQTGVPLAEYQIGPRDTRPDLQIGNAFGRQVEAHQPEPRHSVKLDVSSPTFQKARKFFLEHNKPLAERTVQKQPQVPVNLNRSLSEPARTSTPKTERHVSITPEEMLATHSQQALKVKIKNPDIDAKAQDLDNNPFLKADKRTLKSTKPSQPTEQPQRASFRSIANKVRNMEAVAQKLGGKPSLKDDVLIGMSKVANFENQGIPREYLEKMQTVADAEETIIAVRPVEKICRTLIEEGYASKGLKIKGKSSNWGPMAGFIPVNQHFSKVSGDREKELKYSLINQETLHVKKAARQEQQHISGKRINELTKMGILKNAHTIEGAEGYKAGLRFTSKPQNGPTETFEAHQRQDGQWDIFSGTGEARKPLMVIPVTADFDLLFVHSHYEEVDLGTHDRKQAFDSELGIVSKRKLEIINAMNTEFDRGEGKNMVHHGADTENPVTDMAANLPATVMIPKSMLKNMSIYTESPILIKTEKELTRLYRTMRDNGIKVETNPVWGLLNDIAKEKIDEKIDKYGGRRSSV